MKISELTKEQEVVYDLFIEQLKQFDHDGLVKKIVEVMIQICL